ncbi:probable mediator of RNA polymerase II transcription subunit 19b isoform X2 [Andrographis paniculata]|uniref:probable mediator of RNA polymerase II transcription subunit 19b isoform X2 n=1 Tax=Andrographis paniculata TaxID=175694 RepID=UPI0021E6E133|nr:probable mediator of RNA polymerase II transcription subunit 19b isoform X2 [Andrographis paniculata]
MDTDHRKYGRGTRELTGAVDLVSYYKLFPHHDYFCKRSLPTSISDTCYLYNAVGNAEIRKGEGMQFNELILNKSTSRETNRCIRPFELDILGEAFHLRDANPVDLPPLEKGIPTAAAKPKHDQPKDKKKKHKKHKDHYKNKEKERTKHKRKMKDRSEDKDRGAKSDQNIHHAKKRKHIGDDGSCVQRPKKSRV